MFKLNENWHNVSTTIEIQRFFTCLLVLLILIPVSIKASPITRTFSFEAAGFTERTGVNAPIESVNGSVTVTFDPLGPSILDSVTGITLNSLSFPTPEPISFEYFAAIDELSIGVIPSRNIDSTINRDWLLVFGGASTIPTFTDFFYGDSGPETNSFRALTGKVSLAEYSIPEPPATIILLLGFAGLAWQNRRHRKI